VLLVLYITKIFYVGRTEMQLKSEALNQKLYDQYIPRAALGISLRIPSPSITGVVFKQACRQPQMKTRISQKAIDHKRQQNLQAEQQEKQEIFNDHWCGPRGGGSVRDVSCPDPPRYERKVLSSGPPSSGSKHGMVPSR
jgi:hypothetical protein